jgi:hypothetical protein
VLDAEFDLASQDHLEVAEWRTPIVPLTVRNPLNGDRSRTELGWLINFLIVTIRLLAVNRPHYGSRW